jgi:phosphatidylinositol kinase/protein kinase (PI-3  family)
MLPPVIVWLFSYVRAQRRHPCNLMLDRFTGKIVHIDFGDCFEVAMQREKFPEKIPFRLTRMLINAMEVSGTCCGVSMCAFVI